MKEIKEIELGITNTSMKLKHLKFEYINNEYVATLIDSSGYEIIKGYGNEIIEAINDLHSNLL